MLCNISHSISDCKARICDFHREQAWERWVAATDHGVRNYREEVLSRLRRVARASNDKSFTEAVKDLKESDIWKANKKLSSWFGKTWLTEHKVC